MQDVPGGAAGFMAIAVVAFVILGSVLEGIRAIVLFGPLLLPIERAVPRGVVRRARGDRGGAVVVDRFL